MAEAAFPERWLAFLDGIARSGARTLVHVPRGDAMPVWPPGALVALDDPAAVAPGPDWVVASIRLAPAHGAASVALAVDGGPLSRDAAAVLDRIAADSARESPTAPVPPEVGRLLFVLARALRARRVLDVGTGAGAAAVWLAGAVAPIGGRVTTVERDAARYASARKNVRAAGMAAAVDLRLGELARAARRLAGSWDVVFLDEAADDRADHLDVILPECTPGALVVSHRGTPDDRALTAFDAWVQLDPRIGPTLRLPVGGGLMLARVAG